MWLLYALLAALSFGLRGILYQWTSHKPVNRNLMLFGVFATGAITALLFALVGGHAWNRASVIGCLMGVWSFAGNASMYKGYAVGKASLVALLTGLTPAVVVVLAYFMWNQSLTLLQFGAFLMIICGILFIRYSSELSLDNLKGIHWAVISLFAFGFNDITGSLSTRWEASFFWTMFFMFATGSLLFAAAWQRGRMRNRRLPFETLAEQETAATGEVSWKAAPTFMWGMLVGTTNFAGMYFILHAFDLGKAGLVSAVTALNVVIILIYAGVFLKERFSLKEWVGMIAALVGVLVLRLAG